MRKHCSIVRDHKVRPVAIGQQDPRKHTIRPDVRLLRERSFIKVCCLIILMLVCASVRARARVCVYG